MTVATAATVNGSPALGPPRHSLSVAVIGAGAAGLAAARELLLEGHSVRVFEAADRVGGVWVYTDAVEDDPLGTRPDRSRLHSSMYSGLRTNLPREVMGYACFPFDTKYEKSGCLDSRRFCTHQEVLHYLEAFSARFGLLKYVQFGTKVMRVEPVDGGAAESSNGSALAPPPAEWPRWQVRWRPSAGGDETTEQFNAVMVCNGHYSEPRVPHFPGQDAFPGAQTHSHNYRYPEPYASKRVVLVGAAFSGMDIAQELADAGAAAVYLSAREWTDPATGEAPDGSSVNKVPAGSVVRVGNVVELGANGAVTFDGGVRVEAVDEVMYTTGYVYRFPFLEGTSAAQKIEDNRIVGLYKHVLPPHLAPTLSFIGIPWKVVPFPQFELQSRWVARVLAGRVGLPAKTEMEADVAAYYRFMENEGIAQRHTHRAAGELQSEYNLWLSGAAGDGDAGWPAWRAQLYTKTGELRRATGLGFREAPMEEVAGEALEAAVAEAVRVRAWLEAEGGAGAAMAPLST